MASTGCPFGDLVKTQRNPQPDVTSALAPEFQKADHYRGESSNKPLVKKARKVFEIKILTSNPQRLNILQPMFANPAPVKAFSGWWGEGGTPTRGGFPNWNYVNLASATTIPNYFFE
jgi:hypothetical protein